MRIIVDAMSGDNAPIEIIKGALDAAEEFDAEIVLAGDRVQIGLAAAELGRDISKIEIIDAEDAVTMDDDPMVVVRAKKNSSMAVGMRYLKENADAIVTAGNTGAVVVAASLLVRCVNGVKRPCLATVIPLGKPFLLLDCGANVNVIPEYFESWAYMGSLYATHVLGIKNARVGLLNNGAEEHKGTKVVSDAYALLRESKGINFVGNVEACNIPFGACDVLVTDGFTGNIVLKYTEGFGKFFMKTLKGLYSANARSKLSFLAMKNQIMKLKKEFDATEYGGAPLLGIQKPVIKAHGSADAKVIKNSVRTAITFAKSGIVDVIEEKYR